jgi:uncharacterized protein YkwD
MTRISVVSARGRLTALTLLAVIGSSLVAPVLASAADVSVAPATITAQEARLVGLLNADRAAVGLVPVQVDSRLMTIARARSADMVAKHYFSHTQPDGKNVFSILTTARVISFGAGEIIAWNNYPIDVSASTANRQWMNSPGHKAIVVSTNLNYVGVGLAVDPATGKKVWTAVYIKGPDRTGARVSFAAPTVSSGSTATTRRINLAWSGADVRLQVLTAGLRSYQIERKVDAGAWTKVTGTTGRSLAVPAAKGHVYQFRIVAYDRAGNHGAWSTTTVNLR